MRAAWYAAALYDRPALSRRNTFLSRYTTGTSYGSEWANAVCAGAAAAADRTVADGVELRENSVLGHKKDKGGIALQQNQLRLLIVRLAARTGQHQSHPGHSCPCVCESMREREKDGPARAGPGRKCPGTESWRG
jgi:hypothetical protein